MASRLRSEAVLLDADRVELRAIARIARAAGRYRGRPEIVEWVDAAVVQAIEESIREEHERTYGGRTDGSDGSGVFVSLALPLGLDPESMRKACSAFNHLPPSDRSTFFDLVLRNRSLDEMAREQGESASQVAKRARRALDTILDAALALERDRSP